MTTDEILTLQRQHDELAQAFESLIGNAAYWHCDEHDPLPDGWHEQVTAMVTTWRAHLDEIEALLSFTLV